MTTLPSMRRATALARLDASSCALISLPDDLAECAALEDLVVHRNPDLVSLPPNLGALQPRLRGVWVRECGLATLPSGLTAAVGLADLDAGACRLRGLPDGLGGPGNPRLRTLRVGDNVIASLPRSLARADALEVLDVSGNALTDVDVAASTRGLVELRASRNPDLAELPRGLGRGGALRVLHAAACGLEKLSCDLGKHLVGDGGAAAAAAGAAAAASAAGAAAAASAARSRGPSTSAATRSRRGCGAASTVKSTACTARWPTSPPRTTSSRCFPPTTRSAERRRGGV